MQVQADHRISVELRASAVVIRGEEILLRRHARGGRAVDGRGFAPYQTWTTSERRRGAQTELDGRPVEEVAVDWDRFAPRARPVETLVVVWDRATEPTTSGVQ